MKDIKLILFILIGALLLVSCEKNPNLFEKAFNGKTFDQPAPLRDDKDLNALPDEEEAPIEEEVLVRDHEPEVPGESVFLPENTVDREYKSPFAVDPAAPQINLEEAKIYDIINSLCTLMKVNYIIDPSVQDQTVTIGMVEGETKMKTSELFDLILKLHDLTWVKEAGFIRIVPLDSADVIPGLNMLYGTKSNRHLFQEELSMQIIPLKYVTPEDMSNIIKEFLSPSAKVLEEPKHNAIIIIDKNHFLKKAMDIIPLFDVSALYNKKMVLYNLEYVDCTEIASQLDEIMEAYGYTSENEQVNINPIVSLNGILVISTFREVFDDISFWLEKLDQEAQVEEPTIFIYNVQNTTADNLSAILSSLLGINTSMGGMRSNQAASNRRTTNPTGKASQNKTAKGAGGMTSGQGGMNQQGQGMIVDQENNAIIFHTTPKEYQKIHKTLEKLDVLPRQVFLEVTIFRVDLSNTYSLGFNWSAQNGGIEVDGESSVFSNHRTFSAQDGAAAFSYSFTGLSEMLTANLQAAQTKGYANVLQQPHVMAIDNKPANISIGKDVPIQTQRTTMPTTGGAAVPFSTSNIQYRQTGVTLSVTPHINANGLIRMEIDLGISSPGEPSSEGAAPPINQNDLSTEMIVRNGQTVVMGGMIFDSETGGKNGIPLLSKIPLIKHLFTTRNTSNSRNELIVMITPKVIDNEEDSIRVSREFAEKIKKEYQNYRLD